MELRKALGNQDRMHIDLTAKEDIMNARNRQVNDLEAELNAVKHDFEAEKLAVVQLEDKLSNMNGKCEELTTSEARVRDDLRTDRLKGREQDERIRRLDEALKGKDVEMRRYEDSLTYLSR